MVLIFLSSLYADLQMFVTCLSMERVSVSVTPRFLAEEESVMSELPIDIEEGADGGSFLFLEWMRRISVLSSFSFSLLQVIQRFTSSTHSCMRRTVASS